MRKFLSSVCTLVLVSSSSLRAQTEDFGEWVTLFNGKDLDGWTHAKPDDPNQKGPNRWTVEDGALTNSSGGVNDICTKQEFTNYELEVWYRIPPKGNSGVYLRGQAELQIWDNRDEDGFPIPDDRLEQHHAGAIYSAAAPLLNSQNPVEHWNQFRIRHIGRRVTVWHNGTLVQDNTFVEQTPGRMTRSLLTGEPLEPDRGPIMFQGDHTKVWYSNIRIRPLCAGPGWKKLWNGEDLSEFRSRGEVEDFWKIEDHSFTNAKFGGGRDGGRDLWTKGKYGNFLVHYEYRVDPRPEAEGGNSGFYMRDQWEIQIFGRQQLYGDRGKHWDGAVYSRKAPGKAARNGPTQWNHMDVKVEGQRMWVWQNGLLIHDGVTEELKTRTDNHKVDTPTFTRESFKLQGDHGKVWFTNLYIKELPDSN